MTEVQVGASPGDEVAGIVNDVNSGELLVFPSGTFSWSSAVEVNDTTNWGLRCQPDTVFEVPAGWGEREAKSVLDIIRGDDFLLENLTYDSSGRAAPGMTAEAMNRAHINGLHYRCNGPLSTRKHPNGLNVIGRRPESVLRVDNYRCHNNGDIGAYGSGETRAGVWVGPGHHGSVRFVNPVLSGFPNNGFYVSRTMGDVVVDRGLLMNNNVSQVRVSGNVKVRDTTVVIDVDSYLDGEGVLEGDKHNTRGFWGDSGDGIAPEGGLVTDCSVILQSYRRCTGLVLLGLGNSRLTLENCQFLLNANITALLAADSNQTIETTNCSFDGVSLGSTAARGHLTGSGNEVMVTVDPGTLPIDQRSTAFDWNRIQPEALRAATRPYDVPLLTVEADEGAGEIGYEFVTSGELAAGERADETESVERNDDGTWTATGAVADGDVDDFEFRGAVLAWQADEGDYTLSVEETNAEYMNDTHELTVEAATGVDEVTYTFITSGEITAKDGTDPAESVERNDDGTWTATGTVADGDVDSFEFTGRVHDWRADADVSQYTAAIGQRPEETTQRE
ncbi:hypothetical protein [Halosimplex amylolyticum]|uniref:hypothetical protein n=1 Tax=Halosimplex amylolyticum TaxID=3396616 RepID=UPI003F54B867